MLRSNSKSLGNHVVSPEEEKERLQWERFAEKKAHVKIASRIVSYRTFTLLSDPAATCIRVLFSSWGPVVIGKKGVPIELARAVSLGWPFPTLQYKYIFSKNSRRQFCQTALGNCHGLKLPG